MNSIVPLNVQIQLYQAGGLIDLINRISSISALNSASSQQNTSVIGSKLLGYDKDTSISRRSVLGYDKVTVGFGYHGRLPQAERYP